MNITLRAWDKSRNKMLADPRYELYLSDAHSSVVAINYDISGYEQILDLMVGTGLDDSEGYEIFEGDIIADGCYSWKVIFEDGMFKGSRTTQRDGIYVSDMLSRIVRSGNVEIIGNIYEGVE